MQVHVLGIPSMCISVEHGQAVVRRISLLGGSLRISIRTIIWQRALGHARLIHTIYDFRLASKQFECK